MMGKHRQRSMVHLLKHGSSLTLPRITPVLEGKDRMHGPLDEVLSADDFKYQKVCQDCRNSTEGTEVQCCSICGGEYHTLCLEFTIDANVQNKRLCYSCQIASVPIGQRKAMPSMGIKNPMTEETNIVVINKDANVHEKPTQDAVREVDTNNDTVESAGCSLRDSNGQLLACKLNTYRKRLLDSSEDATACIKAKTFTTVEKENETDKQHKKYKMMGLLEGEQLCSIDRHMKGDLLKSTGLKTEGNLHNFNHETKTLVKDSHENLQQDALKNEQVVQGMLIDVLECTFCFSEKQEEGQSERTAKSNVSKHFLIDDEKATERTLGTVLVKKSLNVESKQSTGLESVQGQLIAPLRREPQNLNTEQYMVNRPIDGTEQNITICIDMDRDNGICSNVLDTNDVTAEKLFVEEKIKRVSDKGIISKKDVEVPCDYVLAKENFLGKRENLPLLRDANSAFVPPPVFSGTSSSMASSLATERKEPDYSHRVLVDVDYIGRKIATSSSIFVGLDSDSTINPHSLPFENADLKPSKPHLLDASSVSISTVDTLHINSKEVPDHDCEKSQSTEVVEQSLRQDMPSMDTLPLKCKEVLEHDIGKRQSAEVVDQSFRQDMVVQNENLDSSVTIIENSMFNQDVAIEHSADIMQSAEVSDHSPQQRVELQSADPDATNFTSCSKATSEEPTNRQLQDISCSKLSTEDEVKVCDICGDAGYEEMLAVCSECNEGAEHVYCMQTLMDQVPEGYWLCEGCKIKHKASGSKHSELRMANYFLTRSPMITYSKKQGSLGNSRLRLTARLEKRKLGPERKQLKGNLLVQGPSKRQAEDAFQAPSGKQTEDTFAPVVKKQVIDISGTSGMSQASSSLTLRPALSREGSFKNPDSGKVKFLSPSVVAGLNATFHGTSSTVRGAGKPVVSNSSLSRTNSGQSLQQAANKNRFVSLTSAMNDSVTGRIGSNLQLNTLIPNSPAMSPSLKNSLSKSSDSGAAHTNLKSSFAGVKMSHKILKEALEGAPQAKESLLSGQFACGNARMLSKGDSFKYAKGIVANFASEQKPLPDNVRIPPRPQIIRTATSEATFKSVEAMVDIHYPSSEPKANAAGTSGNVRIFPSDGTAEPKDKLSTTAIVDGSGCLQVAPLSDGTVDVELKASLTTNLSSSQHSLHPLLPTVTRPVCMNISEASAAVPLQALPSKIGHIILTAPSRDICQQQGNGDVAGKDIGKVSSSNQNISQQDRIHDMAGKESGKARNPNEPDRSQPHISNLSNTLSGSQGKREILSVAASPVVRPEYSSSVKVKGLGSRELGTRNLDLTSEKKMPVFIDKSVSTRCYKCKELGHSSQSCANRSPSLSSTLDYNLSNLQPLLSVTPVNISEDTMQIVVAQSKTASVPEIGNLKTVLEEDVEELPKVSNLQSQKPQIEVQGHGEAQGSMSLTDVEGLPKVSNLQSQKLQVEVQGHGNKDQGSIPLTDVEGLPKTSNLQSQKFEVQGHGNKDQGSIPLTDVEGLPNVSNLQSQKPQIEIQGHGDKVQGTNSLTGPASLGPNHDELEPKTKSCIPFSETWDLPRESCELTPHYFQPTAGLSVSFPRDTNIVVAHTNPFPRPYIPNYRPIGGSTPVTQMSMGHIAADGNPTVFKEASQYKPVFYHQLLPNPSCAARFSAPPMANLSVETALPRFNVPMSISNLASETSISNLSVNSKGQSYWVPGAGISMDQVASAAFTRPITQRPNPQIDSLKSPVAEPYYLWRGAFEVTSKLNGTNAFDGVQAHPSNRAVPKVHEFTRKLHSPLYLEELPRSSEHNSWPLQFQNWPPTNENIALYFFAKDKESYERSYKPLVDHMLKHDLALRGIIEDAELLIFPSNLLPVNSQRWNQFMFLWAVFRDRKVNVSCPVGHHIQSASMQTNVDAPRQPSTDSKKMQRIAAPPPDERRGNNTHLDIQNSRGKLVDKSGVTASSGAAVPCMQHEAPTSQSICVESAPFVHVQDASTLLQGGQEEVRDNSLSTKIPTKYNEDISSVDLHHSTPMPSQEDECKSSAIALGSGPAIHGPMSVSKLVEEVLTLLSKPIEKHSMPASFREDECKGIAIAPGSSLTNHRIALLRKPVEEGGFHLDTTTSIATNTETQVTCSDAFQAPPKKDHNKLESPGNLPVTCQPLPAALVCPSPKKKQSNVFSAVDKLHHSKSRSSGWSRDRERGMMENPYEKGRGIEGVDSARACYRDRDKDRERRYRERDWETERAREWDRNREREREHGRERNREKELEREETLGRDYGRHRDRDHDQCRHKYPYFTSHSRSPPRWRSPTRCDHRYDKYHSHYYSRSYSNSAESAQGSVRQQTPQQTESKGRSQESHSQRVNLSADLVSNSRIEDEKRVHTKGTPDNLVEITVHDSLQDAKSPLKMNDASKSSKEQPMLIADLNVNPVEHDLSETEGLNSISPAISCQPQQHAIYHSFFPIRQMELDEVEHGESSTISTVLADQPHTTQGLDLMGIEESWNNRNYPTTHFYSCHQFFPSEVGGHPSPAKDERTGQILTSLDLALGGARLKSTLGSEIPLVLTLLQRQQNEDVILGRAAHFSGGACHTAEHGKLDLSLAFPNVTEGMQPVIGIDMNKPASEEPVNASLCLFGQSI